jgi:DNA transformation protein
VALGAGLVAFLEEQLAPLGNVAVRRMFGGGGIYCDGVMFGLIADDTVYFKADESNLSAYEREGMEPFTYEGKGKPVGMSYWRVPERLFDEPEELVDWARAALAAGRRAAAKKAPRRKTAGAARKGRA